MTKGMVVRTLWCAVAAVFVVAVVGPRWRSGFPPVYPDSHSYLDVASRNPWSPKFWVDQRPPAYPLFVWLFGSSPGWIVAAQTLCWVAAWAWLMSTAWRRLASRPIAVIAVVVLGLLAVESRWAMWNTQILTESPSGSLAVAGLAAWWRWFAEPGRFRTTVAVALTVAWMLVRDSNALSLLVVAVPAAAVAGVLHLRSERDGPRRRTMTLALAAVLVAGVASIGTQLAADRNTATFHNNMGLRWLPSATMREFFESHGLPVSPALEERSGKDAWADGEAFLRAPELDEYRAWAAGSGRVWAAWSVVARTGWYLDRFHGEIGLHTATDFAVYDSYAVGAHLPDRPLGPLDPAGSGKAMTVWGVAIVALAAVSLWRGRRREVCFVGILGVPVLADLYLSFAGDAIEVGRHLSGGLLRFSIVSVVAVALLADRLVADA
ncbi:MAG TPA: hypothetical protein VNQ73_17135 [Ilumatobacter sp.]|nr:hypothetical protein [Ilumatobacter sp.]